ncbi:hypothetical protein GCM10009096_23560 [Parasphingorhabdus litoris]|uniref:Uncharacterized protein n=1 Tax=Parasphingorhabdus litoris TaxID=394733 RepID=A0ABN1ANM2_9SPHN|nr:hypothetical protein [Parasphingorhabdus litoris]
MTVGSVSGPHAHAAMQLFDGARLQKNDLLTDIHFHQDYVASTSTNIAHRGAKSAVAAEFAGDHRKDEFARIADFTAGRSTNPPPGWRQAGTAELSALGLRGEAISSLPAAEYARVFVSGAGPNQRIAVQFEQQSGHWQKWLLDGGHALGPANMQAMQQSQFVQQLQAASNIAVTVINREDGISSNLAVTAESGSGLKWRNPDLGALAYLQDSGRQAASNMTYFL